MGTLPPWLKKGNKAKGGIAKKSSMPAPNVQGPSPTTAVGGGQFVAKGKKRKSANHPSSITMKGQAGMTTAKATGVPGKKP